VDSWSGASLLPSLYQALKKYSSHFIDRRCIEDYCADRFLFTNRILSTFDLARRPEIEVKETYEGALLEELLPSDGVPQGELLRGSSMATYVIAEAEDGYRAVFSLVELDSGILESDVIVADTMNGAPLAAKEGPFRLVAPHEKRPARWVRMLQSITVVRATGNN
jgi:hypothetical protein